MTGEYFIRTFEEVKKNSSLFKGSEITPRVVKEDHTDTPYVCKIPWEELDKEYAAAIIIWATIKRI